MSISALLQISGSCDGVGVGEVIVNGVVKYVDVVYAKVEGHKVIVKDILCFVKEFDNFTILEVDINSERLVLSPF